MPRILLSSPPRSANTMQAYSLTTDNESHQATVCLIFISCFQPAPNVPSPAHTPSCHASNEDKVRQLSIVGHNWIVTRNVTDRSDRTSWLMTHKLEVAAPYLISD